MNHPKKSFKLDLMSALLIVVILGVVLTMIAQAREGGKPASTVIAAYQVVP